MRREREFVSPSQRLRISSLSNNSRRSRSTIDGGSRPGSSGMLVGYDQRVVTRDVATNKLQLLRSDKLGKFPWLVHAFSTRLGGVSRVYGGNALNLGFTKHDSRAAVERNRELFLKKLGVAGGRKRWPLIT